MLNNIPRYIVIDVDGTMTDAGIYYDEHGNELKKFCTRDAAAFFIAHKINMYIIVLTGRECKATERRMHELGVEFLFQNIKDKSSFLKKFMRENNISPDNIGYIGDDLNDLAPMMLVGYKACPADSCKEIKIVCDYISEIKGGAGAIRDIFENSLLREKWSDLVVNVYKAGV